MKEEKNSVPNEGEFDGEQAVRLVEEFLRKQCKEASSTEITSSALDPELTSDSADRGGNRLWNKTVGVLQHAKRTFSNYMICRFRGNVLFSPIVLNIPPNSKQR